MRLLIETGRNAPEAPVEAPKSLVAKTVSALSPRGGWTNLIRESFPGAWQRNIALKQDDLLCYPTLYACLMRIAKDIGKLPFRLMEQDRKGIWRETENSAYSPVLRKPNHYQTQAQFREAWVLSKLMQGNTYALKQRNNAGRVEKLYILNPWRVRPMVSDSGDVFYEVWGGGWDGLNSLVPVGSETLLIPAREIIHDRELTLHHPLIGVPPLCAAYWPAVKNLKILRSAAEFFENGAMLAGILTAPGALGDDTADRLSEYFNENFTGANAGRIAVVGDGLKFEPFAMKSVDSQMVEQLRYSDEQICQPFGIPKFKVGLGELPAGQKVDDINQLYYSDALQDRIEHMENLLDEGLGIAVNEPLGVELNLEPLLRMDQEKLARVETELVKGSIKTVDEARLRFNLPGVDGGDSIYMQQQNYSLAALAKRDARDDPFATGSSAAPAPAPLESAPDDEQARALVAAITRRFEAA
jgi:HK97 family phage portal protein